MEIDRRPRFNPEYSLLLVPGIVCVFWFPSFDFSRMEAALYAVILLLGGLAGSRGLRSPEWWSVVRRASRNPWICCAAPAITSVLLRLALLPWIPVPHPVVADEFSHLFLAKTFLLGRLANPPHPLWQHFETLHILVQPTYSSMYFVGQACFLVLGKLLTGSFFGGVLLSTALFCAALTWFLRFYVPPGWALYGGMLAAIRFGAASYWNNSYWGGSVAALGAALALGACAALRKRWTTRRALLLAAGVALLVNTRPYESIGLCVVVIPALAVDLIRRGKTPWKSLRWGLAGAAVVLFSSAYFMTREFKAVTGSAFTLPYQINQRMYGWPMTLPWFHPRTVAYRHPEFNNYYEFERGEHDLITRPAAIPVGLLIKLAQLWRFFFGVALSATLLMLDRLLANRRMRVLWIAGVLVFVQAMAEQSSLPHYAAPMTPIVVLFWVQGLRHLMHFRPAGLNIGRAIVVGVVPLMLAVVGARAVELSPRKEPSPYANFPSWCCTDGRHFDRTALLRSFEAKPGKHLLLISYDLDTYVTFDWVYNDPEIDAQKVVFAHDMGPEQNGDILKYYPDRTVWYVRVIDYQPSIAAGPR